jgi:hypothetical protein
MTGACALRVSDCADRDRTVFEVSAQAQSARLARELPVGELTKRLAHEALAKLGSQ